MKFFQLIKANLFRKKVRLLLTLGSFAVALFLFAFLVVVKEAFSRGVDIAGADRLVVVNRIGLIQVMPISYRDKIVGALHRLTARNIDRSCDVSEFIFVRRSDIDQIGSPIIRLQKHC